MHRSSGGVDRPIPFAVLVDAADEELAVTVGEEIQAGATWNATDLIVIDG
ncbi:MAG: hypothetical protein ACKV0T_17470 [Planctomycetales bacterium]